MFFKRLIPFVFLLFFSAGISSAQAALDIYVKVHVLSRYSLDKVEITSPLAKLKVLTTGGRTQEALWPPELPLQLKTADKQVEIRLGNSLQKVDWLQVIPPVGSFLSIKMGPDLTKKFTGRFSVRSHGGALFFIEELPMEDYVRGVLESEIPYGFPLEALKAQAVLIRTFALAHLGRHAKEGFNLCDLTHCQVYSGRELNYRVFEQAVKETKSLILAYEFKPVEAVYHSSCGGHTSAFHKVFGGPMIPYLMGVNDEKYCAKSPHNDWDSSISLKIMEEVLKKDPKTDSKGPISDLKPADREAGGRIFSLNLEGKRHYEVPVNQFMSVVGRYLGWGKMKSNWFEVEVKDGEARFKGKGLGHGVGLCQYGAKGMAEAGKKFDEILFHYFPNTNLIEK